MLSYAIEPLGPGQGLEETLAGRVIPERRYERGPAR